MVLLTTSDHGHMRAAPASSLHDSTSNHGNPPSIPLLFVRITEKKIDFSKNHLLQKISQVFLRHCVTNSLRHYLMIIFWGQGLISKVMGNVYIVGTTIGFVTYDCMCIICLIRFWNVSLVLKLSSSKSKKSSITKNHIKSPF